MGLAQDDNDNYIVGEDLGRYRNFFTFKLPAVERKVVAARLVVRNYNGEGGVTETLDLYDVRTPARQLNNNSGSDRVIYRDLGRGIKYGRFRVAIERDPKSLRGFWLNPAAVADINAARGSYFSIGGRLVTARLSNGHQEFLFGGSEGAGVQELRLFVKSPQP